MIEAVRTVSHLRHDQDARSEDGPQRIELPISRRQVLREHDDHQDLGELAELERERTEGDPAGGAADAVADREREDQETQL